MTIRYRVSNASYRAWAWDCRNSLLYTTVVLIFLLVFSINSVDADSKFVTIQERNAMVNYALGYRLGSDLVPGEIRLDHEAVIAGLRDAFTDQAAMSEQEIQQTLVNLQQTRANSNLPSISRDEAYRLKNQKFLQRNAARENVVTTKSGLQYIVLKDGSGEKPGASDSVTVSYQGKLISGRVFDSSSNQGGPLTVTVDEVLEGWSEALQLMQPGAHWRLFIPPELAYGDEGLGTTIPANSALVFDVELLSVNRPLKD